MTENPYSPPGETSDSTVGRYRLTFVVMFWLSAVLSVLVAALSAFMTYSNFQLVKLMKEMGETLPTYIPLVTLLSFGCSAGLAYSAFQWRKHRPRRGILSLVAVLIVFFAGPPLLLKVLYDF